VTTEDVERLAARCSARGSRRRRCATSSSSCYEPETNGCVEKFIQTLKEQVLWIERFDTLEELRQRIRQFARDSNEHWLLERHGFRNPRQARETLRQPPWHDRRVH